MTPANWNFGKVLNPGLNSNSLIKSQTDAYRFDAHLARPRIQTMYLPIIKVDGGKY